MSIVVFSECWYKGNSIKLDIGEYPRTPLKSIKSFTVPNGVVVTVYSRVNFEGEKKIYGSNIECFARGNELIKSMKKSVCREKVILCLHFCNSG